MAHIALLVFLGLTTAAQVADQRPWPKNIAETDFNRARFELLKSYESSKPAITEKQFLADGWNQKGAFSSRLGIVKFESAGDRQTYALGVFKGGPRDGRAAELAQGQLDFLRRVASDKQARQEVMPAADVLATIEFQGGAVLRIIWEEEKAGGAGQN